MTASSPGLPRMSSHGVLDVSCVPARSQTLSYTDGHTPPDGLARNSGPLVGGRNSPPLSVLRASFLSPMSPEVRVCLRRHGQMSF